MCQPGGMLLFYKLQQGYRKLEMEEMVMRHDSRFQAMHLSVQDFHRFKVDDHELCIDGELYDIKSQVVCNDSLKLVVIRDKDEENILKRIFSITHQTHVPDRDFTSQLKQLLSLSYISPERATCYFIPSRDAIAFQFILSNPVSEFIEISSPPPWKG